MARMFVAVWPPSGVKEVLGRLGPVGEQARLVGSDLRHVTLRFLGPVDEDDEPAVCRVLEEAVAGLLPCRAVLGPATVRLGRAVLAVPVAGLDELGRAVIEATQDFGEPPEDRPFFGHITIARGRGGRPVPPASAGQAVEAEWDVDAVTLVRSHLRPQGPFYEVVFTTTASTTRPTTPTTGSAGD